MKREVEILAPAGSWECLEAAVCAGADAIYIGGSRFGARAHADNLNEERMLEAIDYVHLHGRKLYMTVNTLLKEQELGELVDYLRPYYEQGLDAVIVQDIGAMRLIREAFPDLPLHVSTQATVTQTLSAQLFQRMGAERIVPARELSLEEINWSGDRMFCAWCFVLLLFRTVLNEQYDWRAEWKPRGVCAAMQTSISS